MIKEQATNKRTFKNKRLKADLIVVGGGLSGVCCAITAARQGIKVILVQDRPVLGGNASSEVRLWVLGATSHMGNNNRWAREGGIIDEILVENLYRNPEGNPLIFDSIILEKVVSESNITLLLNTAVYEVIKSDSDTIKSVSAFCSQNQILYRLTAPLFCDASGDGVVGFLSGAAFRMGAEHQEEFGEKFAPSLEYGELLGHSLYFYSKDVGKPVRYVAPSFSYDITQKVPRFKSFNTQEFGCRLWWVEYGGRLDTVHDTEQIKWELWKIVYGVWDYIKNSGSFPEAETLTLEWVGTIPGKRESRRFEGDYMLVQQDIVEQRPKNDAVAFGGWSIDLHPADGIFSEKPGCNQWHSKGVYDIPYRCLYSRNIKNLFLAGRIISASHVAFGSSRVMATSAHIGQAVGMAAVLATQNGLMPRDIYTNGLVNDLQKELLKTGHHLPNLVLNDENDLVKMAKISASSELSISEIPEDGGLYPLSISVAQMIPIQSGKIPDVIIHAYGLEATTLDIELRISQSVNNHTPEIILVKKTLPITTGRNCLKINFDGEQSETRNPKPEINTPQYAYLVLQKNDKIQIPRSQKRISGILSVFNTINKAVSNYGKQTPPEDIGVEAFEFWTPQRRPQGQNVAMKFLEPLQAFKVENIRNGISRPTNQPNAWVADFEDKKPYLELQWSEQQRISTIELGFDTDFDHPLESVLMTHPETVSPFCVQNYRVFDQNNKLVFEKKDNHQSRNTIQFEKPITTQKLIFQFEAPNENSPVALFEIRCYR